MLLSLCAGLPLDPLPENNKRNKEIAHAAKRVVNLTKAERQVKECLLVYFTFFLCCCWLYSTVKLEIVTQLSARLHDYFCDFL